ncbi:phytase [Pseudoalteromonas mariniglutinosa]|uniref:phytase n=1 Tax=Pseudoalteromonas mariniglutinosa TaxID=206042 RepID=UPI00384A7E34
MKYLLATAMLLSLLPITGCSAQQEESAITTLDSEPLYSQHALSGKRGILLSGSQAKWLLTSESQGLLLLDHQAQPISRFSGNFETLAVRDNVTINKQPSTLVATIDNEQNTIKLLSLAQDNTFTLQGSLPFEHSQLETLCLFRQPAGDISLFTADAVGQVHQFMIYNAKQQLIDIQPIRSFTGVPEVQSCAVDDKREQLYLVEGNIGVWQYNANPESDPIRTLVAATRPFGNLQGEVTDVSVTAEGSVWITTPQSQQLHVVQPATGLTQAITLNGLTEPETVSVTWHDKQFQAVAFDAENDNYWQLNIKDIAPQKPLKHALITTITADAQTDPVARFGDAADDPAIWVDQQTPANSLILGTDKRAGLMIYALDGTLLQSLEIGRVNNVDIRQHSDINSPFNTLITASNRTNSSISVFALDTQRNVEHLGDIATDLTDIYGLCMYQSDSGSYVFVNDKDGRYQQYHITATTPNIVAKKVREFALPSQPEGCSADDKTGQLYIGEEDAGIWQIEAEPNPSAQASRIANIGEILKDDVEGMEVYHGKNASYLVVSSQGNDSFVVYGLWNDYPILANFRIDMDLSSGIDGVSETDGLTVTAAALPGYPQGVMIVQDGRNRLPQQPQNFKVIDWRKVQALIEQSGHAN